MGQWNENQIEELLTRMPKLEDRRPKEEVYQYVHQQMQEKHRKVWIIPGLASVAAALLVLVLTLQLFPSEEKQEFASLQNEAAMDKLKEETSVRQAIAVNPSLLKPEGKNYITVAAPDQHIQFVVPLTYIIKESDESLIQALQKTASTINEEKIGLTRNIIQDVKLVENDRKVIVTVGKNHPYGSGSASENVFLQSMKETFRWLPYEEVKFETEGSKGLSLSHSGQINGFLIDPTLQKAYLIYQLDEHYPKLLVPTAETYSSFEEAVEAMLHDQKVYGLQASIPHNVEIAKIESEQSHVTIRFSEQTQLYNEESYLYMLHALMLTARDFGYTSIQFEGGNAQRIGNITLQEKHAVPAAPNVVVVHEENR